MILRSMIETWMRPFSWPVATISSMRTWSIIEPIQAKQQKQFMMTNVFMLLIITDKMFRVTKAGTFHIGFKLNATQLVENNS